MARSRLSLVLACLIAMPLAACSAAGDDSSTGVDAGKKDTGVKDGAVVDTGTPGTDSSVVDTGTPGTDSSVDSGGKSCDQHTGDECDMVKQNCSDSTKTCVYDDGVGHNVCGTVPIGTKLKGEACTTQGDCDKGLFCYGNKCSPACCSGDNSVCGSGGACNLALTNKSGAVVWHACTYSNKCNPFKYDCPKGQVCLFSSEPDVFKCSEPSKSDALGVAPGVSCTYVNDCGESQACFSKTAADGGTSAGSCMLFCWLMTPAGFTAGTTPDGRFPANGTCTVGGKSYGTCKAVSFVGGGLGVCQP